MAEADRTAVTPTAAQLLAARFARELHLQVPVQVEVAAATVATVESASLPAGVDGVLVRRSHGKPQIVLSVSGHPNRRRFTLAHEIGHILIPWHIGDVGCTPEGGPPPDDDIERECEIEANRFASELLVPADWIRSNIEGARTFQDLYRGLSAAEVSVGVVTIALAQHLRPGYVFAEVDRSGRTILGGRSPGTAAPHPMVGQPLDSAPYRLATKETVILGSHAIRWWIFPQEELLALRDGEAPESKAVLDEMLIRHRHRDGHANHVISGVVGAANAKFPDAPIAELVSILRQRFAARADLDWFVRDPKFGVFVEAKAREIVGRRSR